jgi:hypothetical protein
MSIITATTGVEGGLCAGRAAAEAVREVSGNVWRADIKENRPRWTVSEVSGQRYRGLLRRPIETELQTGTPEQNIDRCACVQQPVHADGAGAHQPQRQHRDEGCVSTVDNAGQEREAEYVAHGREAASSASILSTAAPESGEMSGDQTA